MSLLEDTKLDRLPTLREGFQRLLRKGGPIKKNYNACERVRGPLEEILVPSYKSC